MYKNSVPHEEVMREALANDPEFARACLSLALDEGDMDDVLDILRQLAMTGGGMAELAKKTGLHEKSLYKTLSRQGNPLFSTVLTIMSALGLRLVAEAKSA